MQTVQTRRRRRRNSWQCIPHQDADLPAGYESRAQKKKFGVWGWLPAIVIVHLVIVATMIYVGFRSIFS